jgi:hypothetical protein
MDKTTHKGNLNAVETVRVTRMTGDVFSIVNLSKQNQKRKDK